MKKLVLSSIIMLGFCGIASAQTDSKLKQKHPEAATTSAVAPAFTPQKAAIMPASDAAVAADVNAIDKGVATPASPTSPKAAHVAKTEATSVDAAGVVVPAPTTDDAKRRAEKMAAIKAANAAQTGKQQK